MIIRELIIAAKHQLSKYKHRYDMTYIDLNRNFVPIKKDEEVNLDIGLYWGKHIGGWLDWKDLLDNPRVVILAEASSGKTAEFKEITEKLRNNGKAAFFISIEELADEGFDQSLNMSDVSLFEGWKHNFEDGYFFWIRLTKLDLIVKVSKRR